MSINSNWDYNYKILKRYNSYPYDSIISAVLKYAGINKKRGKILDLGCGGGGNSQFFLKEKFDTYAIDGSKESVKLTKKIFNKKNKHKVILGDFKNLPFKNSFFDLIVDRASVAHNKKNDIVKILQQVYDKLKTNGLFISVLSGSIALKKNLARSC